MEGGVKRIDYDIFVTNIPNEAEEDIIRALFSSDGTKVKSVRFLPPKMPNAKASFVSFYSLNDAQNAVMKYNGKEIMRNKINVVLSRKTVEQVHDKPKAMDSVFSWMNGTSSSQNGSCGDEFSPTPTVKKTSPNGSVISSSTNTALLNKLKSFQKRAASVQLPDFEWESEAVLKCDVILEINSGEGCTGLFSKSKNDEDQFYRLTQEISTIDKNSLKSLTESEKNGLKKSQCFLYDQSRVELLQTTANGWLAFKVDEGKLCEINSLENLNHIPTGFLRDCPKMTTLCLPANNYVEFGEAYFNLLQELPYVALHSHMLCKYKGQKDELGRRFVVFVDEKGSVLCPGSEKNSTKAFTRLKISSLTEKHYSKAAILHLVSATEFYLAPDSPKLLSMFQDVTTLDPVPYQIIENEFNPGHCCAVLHDGEFFRASLIKKIKERDGIALSLFFNDYGNSVETRTTPRFQQNSHTAVIFYLPPEEEYHSSSLAILCSLNSTNLIIPESKRKQALELVDDYVIGKLVSIEVFQNGTVDVKPEGQSQSLNHYLTSKGFGGKMPVLNNGEQILNKNVKYPTDTSPVIDLCDGMDVRIVHVAESSFYVIRIIDNKDFQKLMVDIGKIKVNKESVATKDAKCGFWYLTQCTQSGMYNRCILLKIEASNFTVQHLDSGEITKTSKIYPLPEEFKKIPAFALACHFDVPTKDPQGVYKVLKRFYTELSTMNAIVLNKSTVAGTKQYCVELNFEEDGENIKLPHVLIEGNNSNSSNNSTKDSKSETNGPTCLNDTNEKWKIDMEMRVTNIEKKLDEMSTLLLAMLPTISSRPARKAKEDANLRMEGLPLAQTATPTLAVPSNMRVNSHLGNGSVYSDPAAPPIGYGRGTSLKKGRLTGQHGFPGAHDEDDEDTLYGAIKSGRVAPQTLVEDWIEQYKLNRDPALLELLQFFISCSGCRGKIPNVLYERQEYAEIIRKMTEEFDEDSGEYPLIQTGPAWRRFRSSFMDFIHILIQRCQYSIIYDEYMLDQLISFLVGLTDSQVRAFRHTSTLASMKIVTALVTVALNLGINRDNTQRQYDAEKQKSQARRANDRLEGLQQRRQELESHIQLVHNMILFLFKGVFVHRYRDSVSEIRSICIQELGAWMLSYPSMMLDDTYLKYVGWTLFDRVGEVRLQCLRALQPIYENTSLVASMELFTSRFKARLVDMTLDKETDVAVQAVKLVTSILRYNENMLEDKDCENIYELVYCSHRPLAVAAGEFISHKLFQVDPHSPIVKSKRGKRRSANTPQLRDLIQFFIESELHEHAAYLVDSLWDHCPMLRDWECMLDLLLEEPSRGEPVLSQDEEAKLIDILVCCIRQAVTGESPIGRQSSHSSNVRAGPAAANALGNAPSEKPASATTQREMKALSEMKQTVTEHLIPTLPALLMKYGAYKDQVLCLLEIPLHMNLELYATGRQERALDQLLKYLQECVARHTDADVLLACSKAYEALCEENLGIRDKCLTIRDTLLDSLVENFKEAFSAVFESGGADTDEPNPDDEFTLVSALKRIYSFYSCHDLTSLDLWPLMMRICEIASIRTEIPSVLQEEAVAKAINCCRQCILWYLHRIDETKPDKGELKAVKKMLNQFMCLCTGYLDHSSTVIAQEAYIMVCDILVVFSRQLSEALPALSPLVYEPDHDIESGLVQYLEHRVFVEEEKTDEGEVIEDLHNRRTQLAVFCKLIIYNVLPIFAAASAYRHYIRFFSDFGDIMKTTLAKARDICRIDTARMIARCLQLAYADLEAIQTGTVDRNSEGFTSLKELARRFNLSFGLDLPKIRQAISTLHLDSIQYCKQAQVQAQQLPPLVPPDEPGRGPPPPNLLFLEVISEFSNKLLRQDRKYICEYLNKTFPGSTGQAWVSLLNYRASVDPESVEMTGSSVVGTTIGGPGSTPSEYTYHPTTSRPRGRPPKRPRESIGDTPKNVNNSSKKALADAALIAIRSPTVRVTSDTKITISLNSSATLRNANLPVNQKRKRGGGSEGISRSGVTPARRGRPLRTPNNSEASAGSGQ